LLEARRAEIESVKRRTFAYGAVDRQQLDVYYPSADSKLTTEVPVLFFIYGGGFVEGSKIYPPPYDLTYANLGAFFAKRGFITIIPDYRLVPSVKFPEPVEDVRDAIDWAIENSELITREDGMRADFNNIFAMSHSAGSMYLSTMMLYPGLLPDDIRRRICGLVLKGGVYKFNQEKPLVSPVALMDLFGSWENVYAKTPLTLLQSASADIIQTFPDVLMLASEREPEGVIPVNEEFAAALSAKLGKEVPFSLMKGHNHISPHAALYSGQGEEWGTEVEQWIKARVVPK